MNIQEPKIEKKQVKYTFTREEKERISCDLVTELARQSSTELELQQVKSNYKARLDESTSKIGLFTQNLQAGCEYRWVECRVEFRRKDKKKDFFSVETGVLACTEDMTQEDFQLDLALEDSKFDSRVEIPAWNAGPDKAVVVLAKSGEKWVTAIRAKLGVNTLSERLSSEGKTFKERYAAVKTAFGRLSDWVASVSPGAEKSFADGFKKILELEKERVE